MAAPAPIIALMLFVLTGTDNVSLPNLAYTTYTTQKECEAKKDAFKSMVSKDVTERFPDAKVSQVVQCMTQEQAGPFVMSFKIMTEALKRGVSGHSSPKGPKGNDGKI